MTQQHHTGRPRWRSCPHTEGDNTVGQDENVAVSRVRPARQPLAPAVQNHVQKWMMVQAQKGGVSKLPVMLETKQQWLAAVNMMSGWARYKDSIRLTSLMQPTMASSQPNLPSSALKGCLSQLLPTSARASVRTSVSTPPSRSMASVSSRSDNTARWRCVDSARRAYISEL